jgi:hypothetical protein
MLAERELVGRMRDLAKSHLIDNVDRTAAAIVRSSVQGVESIDVEQLEFLGRAFARLLRRD